VVRIVAGHVKGRRLKSPDGGVRPTTGRVRTSLFDSLSPWIPGRSVLDLCAGTGSLGIEALSRGALCAIFVDSDSHATRAIEANLSGIFDTNHVSVWLSDAIHAIEYLSRNSRSVDLIVADPPYDTPIPEAIIQSVAASHVLSMDGRLIVEHSAKIDYSELDTSMELLRTRKYGNTALSFFRPDTRQDGAVIKPIQPPIDIPTPRRTRR
jgi:16S rRNA (guanine966-N2)-methyltransferase